MSSEKGKGKSALREWIEAFLWAFLAVLFLRILVIEAFTIPTTSMEHTLRAGDFVVVSKLHYGARLPITPLSFPFSHQHIPFTHRKGYSDAIQFPYLRLPGFSKIKRNDVIVFNNPRETDLPVDHRTHFIKRCIAVPGDTVHINEGLVYINGIRAELPDELMMRYRLKVDTSRFSEETFDDLDISDFQRYSIPGYYHLPLTTAGYDSLSLKSGVELLEPAPELKGSHDFKFPFHVNYAWTLDNYGPLVIPAKGNNVELNKNTLPLYEDIITGEGHSVEVTGDTILIDSEITEFYEFEKEYFFVLGDNRYYSADSRYWGFVPEDHVVGKAWFVLFSVHKSGSREGKVRSDRFFKPVE